jgi:hypothetical protein
MRHGDRVAVKCAIGGDFGREGGQEIEDVPVQVGTKKVSTPARTPNGAGAISRRVRFQKKNIVDGFAASA